MMSVPFAQASATEKAPAASDARVQGRWLILARGVWVVVAAGLLANWVVSLFAYSEILRTVCTAPDPVECHFWQPRPENVRTALAPAHQHMISL